MTISGGIKFFSKSFCDIDYDDVAIAVSTGSGLSYKMRDRRTWTKWQSSGSNDSTQESITVTFSEAKAINRLLLVKNNFKAFNAQYWNGSAWTHFANVVTKEGTQSNITETNNAKTTNYYEFTEVSTTKVRVQIDTTQTVNAEKYLYDLIITKEIGTLQGYPNYTQVFAASQVKKDIITGKSKYSIFDEAFTCSLAFQRYPKAEDHTLIQNLWEGREEFLIYPCGSNADQFRFSKKGNRLEDIYLVWFEGNFDPNYAENCYQLGLNYSVALSEVA